MLEVKVRQGLTILNNSIYDLVEENIICRDEYAILSYIMSHSEDFKLSIFKIDCVFFKKRHAFSKIRKHLQNLSQALIGTDFEKYLPRINRLLEKPRKASTVKKESILSQVKKRTNTGDILSKVGEKPLQMVAIEDKKEVALKETHPKAFKIEEFKEKLKKQSKRLFLEHGRGDREFFRYAIKNFVIWAKSKSENGKYEGSWILAFERHLHNGFLFRNYRENHLLGRETQEEINHKLSSTLTFRRIDKLDKMKEEEESTMRVLAELQREREEKQWKQSKKSYL